MKKKTKLTYLCVPAASHHPGAIFIHHYNNNVKLHTINKNVFRQTISQHSGMKYKTPSESRWRRSAWVGRCEREQKERREGKL